MKNRIEFYAGLNTYAPNWQEIMPRCESEIRGRFVSASEWADELGVSQPTVHADLSEKSVITQKPDKGMKPLISKYRQKVMARTLMGQKLAEAIKANGPGVCSTRPVNFVTSPTKEYHDEELSTN